MAVFYNPGASVIHIWLDGEDGTPLCGVTKQWAVSPVADYHPDLDSFLGDDDLQMCDGCYRECLFQLGLDNLYSVSDCWFNGYGQPVHILNGHPHDSANGNSASETVCGAEEYGDEVFGVGGNGSTPATGLEDPDAVLDNILSGECSDCIQWFLERFVDRMDGEIEAYEERVAYIE